MKIKFSTRLVILTKKRAYKIPIDRRGWLQGRNEKRIWDSYKDTGFLAPLIWERFGIVCQQRVDPVIRFNRESVLQAKFEIPQFDINNCDLWNKENWGTYEGRQVLLDYGIDEEISKMY